MKGFLGFHHEGHPCFDRDLYESFHEGEDELQRIEDALGLSFSGFDEAMYFALTHARYLLYRVESDDIDRELLRGRDPWAPFRGGYVHVVTGEYVEGPLRPKRDSYPCWVKEEPASRYHDPGSALGLSGLLGVAAMTFGMLAA
ncbi:MAG: hypothetical protein K6F32_00995, partial [Bacilli bacterium]|nr:hypothetical protein [Bacilli bacterium]